MCSPSAVRRCAAGSSMTSFKGGHSWRRACPNRIKTTNGHQRDTKCAPSLTPFCACFRLNTCLFRFAALAPPFLLNYRYKTKVQCCCYVIAMRDLSSPRSRKDTTAVYADSCIPGRQQVRRYKKINIRKTLLVQLLVSLVVSSRNTFCSICL